MNFRTDKEYVCVCGKVCKGSQSFNDHKTHCKVHRGEEAYLLQLEADRQALRKGLFVIAENRAIIAREKEKGLLKSNIAARGVGLS